ncbi:hypothetical protein GQ457_04G032330 [Hibiscus cannabinus]
MVHYIGYHRTMALIDSKMPPNFKSVQNFSGGDKTRNDSHGLIGDMLKLQKSFVFQGSGGGVIQKTTTEAILMTLIAAKDKALTIISANDVNKLSVYGSDQTHSTFASRQFSSKHKFNPDDTRWGFSLSPFELRTVVKTDVTPDLVSVYLCLNLKTTLTTTTDLVEPLAIVAKGHEIWVHVDAAYVGSACKCLEFRHHLNGIERIDSLSLSPHK